MHGIKFPQKQRKGKRKTVTCGNLIYYDEFKTVYVLLRSKEKVKAKKSDHSLLSKQYYDEFKTVYLLLLNVPPHACLVILIYFLVF